ncbi:chorismate mutase [Flavimaribacter sediminis]|nr:chorismate mutase family protein [Flavimaribacter sediminis]
MKTAEDCQTMVDIRVEIDRLDRDLMKLLAERSTYVDRAADIKRVTGEAPDTQWRVKEVLDNARRNASDNGLDPDFAEALWRHLLKLSISQETDRLNQN